MILITGGTGLVGTHVLYDLVTAGKRVRALQRKDSNTAAVLHLFSIYSTEAQRLFDTIEWVIGDIEDVASLEEAMTGVDQVYHCAAMISFHPKDREHMLRINVEGTANVVNACLEKKISKLCHVSSIATLGRNSTVDLVHEETHWKTSPDNSYYAISKYGGEREVWRGAAEGLQVIVVNPSVIIGPGDWSKGSIAVFRLAYAGLKYYTSGQTGFVDVRDVSRAMIVLMESDIQGERFLLNGGNLTFRTFFDLLHAEFGKAPAYLKVNPLMAELGWRLEKLRARLVGREPVITKETARAANLTYSFSSEKIKKKLGFEFIPIEKSIQDICSIYKKEKASVLKS